MSLGISMLTILSTAVHFRHSKLQSMAKEREGGDSSQDVLLSPQC